MWFLYAALTVLFTTILGISFRKIALKTSDQRAFSFAYNLSMFCIALVIVLLTGLGDIDLNRYYFGLLVLSGIGYGLFQRYQFAIRKHIEASTIQTVVMPSGLVGFILAIIWLGEALTLTKVVGYLLVILATLLIVAPKSHLKLNKWVLGAFLIGAALSIAGTIDREVSQQFSSALTYTAALLFFHALLTYVPFVKTRSLLEELRRWNWRIPVLAAINVASLVALIKALQLAPASQVLPVTQSNVVFMALAGILILKERSRTPIKILAAAITFIGLFLISR